MSNEAQQHTSSLVTRPICSRGAPYVHLLLWQSWLLQVHKWAGPIPDLVDCCLLVGGARSWSWGQPTVGVGWVGRSQRGCLFGSGGPGTIAGQLDGR